MVYNVDFDKDDFISCGGILALTHVHHRSHLNPAPLEDTQILSEEGFEEKWQAAVMLHGDEIKLRVRIRRDRSASDTLL